MSTGTLLDTGVAELSEDQFNKISSLVKSICGINLHDGKRELVKARLSKRLRTLQLASFEEYLHYVRDEQSGSEITFMLNALSTNLTSFFREASHFEHLTEEILAPLAARSTERRVRVWSAGCSSGEEPYCLAIVMRETISDLDQWDAKILATDLSTRILKKAIKGIYDEDRLKTVPPGIRHKYFRRTDNRSEKTYSVTDNLRGLIKFARLNLMEAWPMNGPFDVIFCRNVMIYFDKPTQNTLVRRFWDLLRPGGGTLFIGHSESLTGIRPKFQYVKPTIY
ncbi:MAG: protein-glutamate O-methyltransferase, partial [Planctomycetes bacterium]|nr:protein-glutamate O-methyltransferase [Planctomycetota bacterium]